MKAQRSEALAAAGFCHGFGTRLATRRDYPRILYTLRQVHGDAVAHIGPPLPDRRFRFTVADAVLTRHPGVAVGVRTADCLPVLLADTAGGAVAAVHCGWRSLAAGLIGRTVEQMGLLFGTRAKDVLAVLGPSIRACCYEVGPEVMAAFAAHPGVEAFAEGDGSLRLDLARAARSELRGRGIETDRIETVGGCTRCRPDLYHSWRGERTKMRMVNWISAHPSLSR